MVLQDDLMDGRADQAPEINYLGFNQDQTCLAVGTWCGFRIFSMESFMLLHSEACGAVSLIEMLFRTSLLALVGGASPRAPAASCRELTMWNTKERCRICQLHFNSKIHGVKMNHRRIVVLLQQKIHIFDLKTMKSLHVIDRTASPCANPALAWLCAAWERGYLATPLALAGSAPGEGQSHTWASVHPAGPYGAAGLNLAAAAERDGARPPGLRSQVAEAAEAQLGLVTVVDTYTLKPVGTVLAHRSPVQALCLNPTGQLLATASTKGTVVRLFAVPALDMLYSFRRGASACRIFGLLFSRDSALVCASAASGTVHIFRNSEKVLGSLPLQSEEATVGAAQREMISRSGSGTGPPPPAAPPAAPPQTITPVPPPPPAQQPIPREGSSPAPAAAQQPVPPVRLGPAAAPPTGADAADSDAEELSEWNVVTEQPERLLERLVNVPSYHTGDMPLSDWKNAMHTLSAVSEYAAEHTARYAKSLLQLLPQPCRELVDAPRAFAWVHMRGGEDPPRAGGDTREAGRWPEACRHVDALYGLPKLPLVLGGQPDSHALGGYVACVSTRPRAGNRAEVLVATVRGCAHVYEWNPAVGGECRLREEHSFMGQWPPPSGLDSLQLQQEEHACRASAAA